MAKGPKATELACPALADLPRATELVCDETELGPNAIDPEPLLVQVLPIAMLSVLDAMEFAAESDKLFVPVACVLLPIEMAAPVVVPLCALFPIIILLGIRQIPLRPI